MSRLHIRREPKTLSPPLVLKYLTLQSSPLVPAHERVGSGHYTGFSGGEAPLKRGGPAPVGDSHLAAARIGESIASIQATLAGNAAEAVAAEPRGARVRPLSARITARATSAAAAGASLSSESLHSTHGSSGGADAPSSARSHAASKLYWGPLTQPEQRPEEQAGGSSEMSDARTLSKGLSVGGGSFSARGAPLASVNDAARTTGTPPHVPAAAPVIHSGADDGPLSSRAFPPSSSSSSSSFIREWARSMTRGNAGGRVQQQRSGDFQQRTAPPVVQPLQLHVLPAVSLRRGSGASTIGALPSSSEHGNNASAPPPHGGIAAAAHVIAAGGPPSLGHAAAAAAALGRQDTGASRSAPALSFPFPSPADAVHGSAVRRSRGADHGVALLRVEGTPRSQSFARVRDSNGLLASSGGGGGMLTSPPLKLVETSLMLAAARRVQQQQAQDAQVLLGGPRRGQSATHHRFPSSASSSSASTFIDNEEGSATQLQLDSGGSARTESAAAAAVAPSDEEGASAPALSSVHSHVHSSASIEDTADLAAAAAPLQVELGGPPLQIASAPSFSSSLSSSLTAGRTLFPSREAVAAKAAATAAAASASSAAAAADALEGADTQQHQFHVYDPADDPRALLQSQLASLTARVGSLRAQGTLHRGSGGVATSGLAHLPPPDGLLRTPSGCVPVGYMWLDGKGEGSDGPAALKAEAEFAQVRAYLDRFAARQAEEESEGSVLLAARLHSERAFAEQQQQQQQQPQYYGEEEEQDHQQHFGGGSVLPSASHQSWRSRGTGINTLLANGGGGGYSTARDDSFRGLGAVNGGDVPLDDYDGGEGGGGGSQYGGRGSSAYGEGDGDTTMMMREEDEEEEEEEGDGGAYQYQQQGYAAGQQGQGRRRRVKPHPRSLPLDSEIAGPDDPPDVVFKGSLMKCNPSGRSWKVRYCVLTSSALIYYGSRAAAVADMGSSGHDVAPTTRKGAVDLTGARIELGEGGAKRRGGLPGTSATPSPSPHVFRVVTGRRTFIFAASDGDSLLSWVGALCAVTGSELDEVFGTA